MAATKRKTRSSGRTGLIRRIEVETEASEAQDDFGQLLHGCHSEDALRAQVTAFIDSTEKIGLHSLDKHGLPSLPGLLQQTPDGNWAPAVEGSDRGPRLWAHEIASLDGDPNSEVSFAARLLWAVHEARHVLADHAASRWLLVHRIVRLMEARHSLLVEFGYTVLAGAVKQAQGRIHGASATKSGRDTNRRIREAEIERACAELWARNPSLRSSASRTAKHLERPLGMKADTLRKLIPKKLGSTTPP
jgi:hypothetical protein